MKKLVKVLSLLVVSLVSLMLSACNLTEAKKTTEAKKQTTVAQTTVAQTTEAGVKYVKCNHEQFVSAEDDTPVEITAYVQAHQSWWDNKVTVYLQDADGGYFAYNMACSEADAAKLTAGTKITIKGYKTTWQGEVEIAEGATFEFVEAEPFVAQATDVTALLGTEDLIAHQNEYVAFKAMVVTEVAKYKWDGSGKQGDDLYFTVRALGSETTYSFTVESYLCSKDTAVYKAVEALEVGDIVNLEGFLYWYAGLNPHITSCQTLEVLTNAQYKAIEDDEEVLVSAYVQAHQSWWNNSVTVYLQDENGGYFAYNMVCSETDAAKLTAGKKVLIYGYKTTWQGEIEIASGSRFEFVEAEPFVATATNVTSLLGTNELINHQNEFVSFKGMEVVSVAKYKWDNSGKQGDDLYFDVKVPGTDATYSFTVESYLCDMNSDVYKAVEALKVGDIVDLEGFLYWYDGLNPHITSCTRVPE